MRLIIRMSSNREIIRNLENIIEGINDGKCSGFYYDINGNTIGSLERTK